MFAKIKKQELKIHFMFIAVMISVMTFTMLQKIWDGGNFQSAIWQAVTSIRLMELGLFVGFWYQATIAKRTDAEKSGTTSLHLND